MSEQLKTYEELERENADLRKKVDNLNDAVTSLQQKYDWLKRFVFGSKSEKRIDVTPSQQLELFPEFTAQHYEREHHDTEQAQEQGQKKRSSKKQRIGSASEPGLRFEDDVPVRVIELTPEELKGGDADNYEIIGTRTVRRLAQRTSSYEVIEYRKPIIKHIQKGTIKNTPSPESVFEHSIADVSFASGILVDKFAYHLPLYRQHQRLQQAGIYIARSTLTNIVE
ncbi:transposase, partial [Halorhodospira halochloris]|nr:transposase [Halorhodospira halochloris]